MRKTRKSLLAAVLAASFLATGCAGGNTTQNETGTQESVGDTTASSDAAIGEADSSEGTEASEGNTQAEIKAGTYTAEEQGYGGSVTVTLTVDENGIITDGTVNASTETDKIGQAAAPEVIHAIIEKNSSKVDAVTGATITSEAIMGAAAKALEQAGMKTEDEQLAKGEDEEITVDVAVVGAGLSGLAAAGAAIDAGASVLAVEKSNNVGGISKFFSGGPFAVESHLQKDAGGKYAEITSEQLIQTLNDYSHYINYAPLTKNIVENSAETIEFLESWGLTFHVNEEAPQLAHQSDDLKWRIYHWFDTFSYEPTDVSASDVLKDNMVKKGLDLRLQTTAKELIIDGNGAVTGFVAEKADGGKLTVHAKAVVLGTGGFAGNAEMMKEYFHTDGISAWGETGSGVQMAWAAGADKWDVQSALLHGSGIVNATNPTDVSLSSSPFNQIVRSPLLWIDRSGNRFGNEEAVYDTAYTSNLGYSVGGIYYIVVDTATLNAYTEGKHLVTDPAVGGANFDSANFAELAEEGVKQGNVFKGESLEELAEAAGMDPAKLVSNIEAYNKACETKEDPYGKSAENLEYPVSVGPFYAVKMQISNLGTLGGVRVSENLEAVDSQMDPIPGLYVVGNDAGGFYGNTTTYPPYEGLATGFALNSGKIGGRSAADYALNH